MNIQQSLAIANNKHATISDVETDRRKQVTKMFRSNNP